MCASLPRLAKQIADKLVFSFLGWLVCECMHTLAHHNGGPAQVRRRMENFGQVMSAAGRSVPLLGSLQYALVFRQELTFDLL